jgi:SAM-dependent methyltransferase
VSALAFSDFGDPEFAAEFARRRVDRAERVAGRIVELAGIGAGDHVVDLCCGPGLVAARFAERVGATGEVIGIDSSSAMISLARTRAQTRNVRFLEGDAYSFSSQLPDPVDHVVATSAWQNFLTERAHALDEIGRALKPGGRFSFDVRLRSAGSDTTSSWRVIARTLAVRFPDLALPDRPGDPSRRPYTSEELDRDLSLMLGRGFRLVCRDEVAEQAQGWREQRGWRFEWWLRRTAPALPAEVRAEILSELEHEFASAQDTGTSTRRTIYVVVETAS